MLLPIFFIFSYHMIYFYLYRFNNILCWCILHKGEILIMSDIIKLPQRCKNTVLLNDQNLLTCTCAPVWERHKGILWYENYHGTTSYNSAWIPSQSKTIFSQTVELPVVDCYREDEESEYADAVFEKTEGTTTLRGVDYRDFQLIVNPPELISIDGKPSHTDYIVIYVHLDDRWKGSTLQGSGTKDDPYTCIPKLDVTEKGVYNGPGGFLFTTGILIKVSGKYDQNKHQTLWDKSFYPILNTEQTTGSGVANYWFDMTDCQVPDDIIIDSTQIVSIYNINNINIQFESDVILANCRNLKITLAGSGLICYNTDNCELEILNKGAYADRISLFECFNNSIYARKSNIVNIYKCSNIKIYGYAVPDSYMDSRIYITESQDIYPSCKAYIDSSDKHATHDIRYEITCYCKTRERQNSNTSVKEVHLMPAPTENIIVHMPSFWKIPSMYNTSFFGINSYSEGTDITVTTNDVVDWADDSDSSSNGDNDENEENIGFPEDIQDWVDAWHSDAWTRRINCPVFLNNSSLRISWNELRFTITCINNSTLECYDVGDNLLSSGRVTAIDSIINAYLICPSGVNRDAVLFLNRYSPVTCTYSTYGFDAFYLTPLVPLCPTYGSYINSQFNIYLEIYMNYNPQAFLQNRCAGLIITSYDIYYKYQYDDKNKKKHRAEGIELIDPKNGNNYGGNIMNITLDLYLDAPKESDKIQHYIPEVVLLDQQNNITITAGKNSTYKLSHVTNKNQLHDIAFNAMLILGSSCATEELD